MSPNDDRSGADSVARLKSMFAATLAGSLRLASRLNEIAWEQAAAALEIVDAAGRPARTARPAPEPPPGPPPGLPGPAPAPVRLDARPGQSVLVPFLVENRYDRDVEVSFTADPLVGGPERALPPEAISFDPPTATLAPGGRLVARATIHLGERCVVGETYSTALRVRRPPAPPLYVAIAVVPGPHG